MAESYLSPRRTRIALAMVQPLLPESIALLPGQPKSGLGGSRDPSTRAASPGLNWETGRLDGGKGRTRQDRSALGTDGATDHAGSRGSAERRTVGQQRRDRLRASGSSLTGTAGCGPA